MFVYGLLFFLFDSTFDAPRFDAFGKGFERRPKYLGAALHELRQERCLFLFSLSSNLAYVFLLRIVSGE